MQSFYQISKRNDIKFQLSFEKVDKKTISIFRYKFSFLCVSRPRNARARVARGVPAAQQLLHPRRRQGTPGHGDIVRNHDMSDQSNEKHHYVCQDDMIIWIGALG